MRIVAVVPIKLNNERFPGKNTVVAGGKPLICHILNTLAGMDELDAIYVYCSDESVTRYLPPRVQFLKRPCALDLPESNFTQIFGSFSEKIKADIYLYTHATAPLLTKQTLTACINKVKGGEHDSAFTAELFQEFLWQDGKPLNFDPAYVPRTQDLPKIYKETSGAYVFKRSVFEKYRRRVGEDPFLAVVSKIEAIDINYPDDLELADFFLRKETYGQV